MRDEKQDDIKGYILSKCRNLVPGFDAGEVIHTPLTLTLTLTLALTLSFTPTPTLTLTR